MSPRENEERVLAAAITAGITDSRELANFMAQMQVESEGFARLSEKLNYSGKRLFEVFRGRNGIDSLAQAETISAGGPRSIANAIYGGDWGRENLRNTEPGDGWRFRGRGFVQLTGRASYIEASRSAGVDLVAHPEMAEDPAIAATIAVDYWKRKVASRGHQFDVRKATKDINNGRHGLNERRLAMSAWQARFERQSPQQVLAAIRNPIDPARPTTPTGHAAAVPPAERLRKGQSGDQVSELQVLLDRLGYRDGHGHRLHADGDFGERTEAAVRAFQAARGLQPVGFVGPKTHAALEAARLAGPSPVDPAHPDHALQQQIARGVDAMERAMGRVADGGSQRVVASLLVAAREQGLTRVDHVVLSIARGDVQGGQNVFAVQGRLDDPASRRVHVATQQALATPVDSAFARLAPAQVREAHGPRHASNAPRAAHAEYGSGLHRFPSP